MVTEVVKLNYDSASAKLAWIPSKKGLILTATLSYAHGVNTPTGLRSEHLDPVQEWCVNNKCGTRISFDMFRFRNNKEKTLFLLRWG